MAVYRLKEIPQRGGRYSSDGRDDAQRTFRAWSDSAADTHASIVEGALAFGLPKFFDQHPGDPTLLVRDIAPRQQDQTLKIWLINVGYASDTSSSSAPGQEDNPELEPVKRNWSRERVMLPLIRDLDGKPVMNTVGETFDPPVEVRRSLPKLTFVRNEIGWTGSTSLAFLDHVNSISFAGGAPGTVYCDDITAEERFKRGASYWVVTYVFLFDPRGWQPRPINIGYYQYIAGKRSRIKDKDGDFIAVPVPINFVGTVIPESTLPGAAVYLDFKGYDSIDFNSLGLPS